MDWADPWIPCRKRGEWLHHGGDVCGIVVSVVDGTFGGRLYFPYYSYRRKTTEQIFFVPPGTLKGVILLSI